MNSSPESANRSHFRQELIRRTARYLADQQSAITQGERPRWDEMTPVCREDFTESFDGVLLSMDQAMVEMVERGLVSQVALTAGRAVSTPSGHIVSFRRTSDKRTCLHGQ